MSMERKIPNHVAIILDGTGRWAKAKGMPRNYGHVQGAKTVEVICEEAYKMGIKYLTVYAFSTENWGRSKIEVTYLMNMLAKYLKERLPELMAKNVRLHAIGELYMLPKNCRKQLEECLEKTKGNTAMNLVLALSYGSRQEITSAARAVAEMVQRGEIAPADITPELLGSKLYTAGMPDPDLLIRTSGEMRISNYLLWQISYAELWVTDVLWPDFGRAELDAALASFHSRNRRFGKR